MPQQCAYRRDFARRPDKLLVETTRSCFGFNPSKCIQARSLAHELSF
jgi:hypothetical protein